MIINIGPRYRRLDLIQNLPVGGQGMIAKYLGYSRGFVSSVLNGYRSQSNKSGIYIIRLAEKYVRDGKKKHKKQSSKVSG